MFGIVAPCMTRQHARLECHRKMGVALFRQSHPMCSRAARRQTRDPPCACERIPANIVLEDTPFVYSCTNRVILCRRGLHTSSCSYSIGSLPQRALLRARSCEAGPQPLSTQKSNSEYRPPKDPTLAACAEIDEAACMMRLLVSSLVVIGQPVRSTCHM